MTQENFSPETTQVERRSYLNDVTPLSKYLAMLLFIILPFLGGYVGYTFAPEKIVEIEKITIKEAATDLEVEMSAQESRNNYSVETKTYRDDELGITFDYPTIWG